jgi:hypothetical protein
MKKRILLTASTAAALLAAALVGPPSAASDEPSPTGLERGNWAPHNYETINNLIGRYRSSDAEAESAQYAVFDWDNTSIINDVTDKLFLYQMDTLNYRLTPDQFRANLTRTVPPGQFADSVRGADGQRVSLEDITADLTSDYTYLYSSYEGLAGTKPLAEVTTTDQFRDFKAKFYFLFEAIIDTHGKHTAYPWEIFFVDNMTRDEFRDLALASIRHQMQTGIGEHTLTSPAGLSGKTGRVTINYTDGLRTVPEIANLTHTFQANGIDVYVVSAGFEPLVEAIASSKTFGYNIPTDKVFGLRLEQAPDGTYEPEYRHDYPVTYGPGKPEVIHQEIAGDHEGRDPVFVAGDSGSDLENLTTLKGMKLGLLVNYLPTGDLGKKVAKKAAATLHSPNPRYLLQGVDEYIGLWQPTEKSLLLGETEPRLLNPNL